MTQPVKRRLFIPRPGEFKLILWLLPATFFLFLAAVIHRMTVSQITMLDFIIPTSLIVSSLIAHGLLLTAGSKADETLLPAWTLLLFIGLIFQFRLGILDASSWKSPGSWVVVAGPIILALTAVMNGNLRFKILYRMRWLWILLSFGICVFVLATGIHFRGGTYGPGKTTPTEFVKPLLILGLAGLLARRGQSITKGTSLLGDDSRHTHIIVIGSWLLTGIVLVLLKDLGMLAATGALCIAMLTVTTGRKTYVVTGSVLAVAGAWFFKEFVSKGRVRFEAWLQPFDHPDSSGFQTVRSLFALFNGEFFGQGIGNGFPKTIPLADTDFTYAALGEELGWFGTVILLFITWHIARQALYSASQSKDVFAALICVGCATVWSVQVLLHAGGVIKLIPMTGVPFPGLSTGGTAILVFSILAGWIMAVSDSNCR